MQKRKVPFIALGGLFEQDDVDAAVQVLREAAKPGGSFFPLPEETDFQEALAQHEGAAKAIIVNSCGTALDLMMLVLGIGPGDEVITTGQTFICTATCAAARGAKVVFADIDPVTMCLDPAAVEKKITDRTRAIIPVHFAGLAADVEAFERISNQHNIPVVYDSAHAVGSKWRGQPLGKWGTAGCYSFQSNKNMTTIGEGGAVLTNDPDLAERVRQAKTFGYVYGAQLKVVSIGFNYRMTKPQAAVGLTQLAKLDRVIGARLERFLKLNELLKNVPEVTLPVGLDDGHACHLYIIRLDLDKLTCHRDRFRKILQDQYQVGTGCHYPAVWSWGASEKFEYDNRDCPHTEQACNSVVTLPVFPGTTEEELAYIAWAVKEAISQNHK